MTDWNVDPALDLELDRAIRFLAAAMEASGHNPKPVVLHSVRVGVYLRGLGYPRDIVLAGFLHDVLEDSDTKPGDVTKRFGRKVGGLVKALSDDPAIRDRRERFRDTIRRMVAAGPPALIVSAADRLDNLPFFKLTKGNPALRAYLLEKALCFLDVSKPLIGEERIWKALAAGYRRLPGWSAGKRRA